METAMISISSINISQADMAKRKRENFIDHVRTAVNDLIQDPAHKPELTKVMRIINESLAKRLIYTDILSVERKAIMREIRIINESIEKIESAEELTHEDRRDKKRSVQND